MWGTIVENTHGKKTLESLAGCKGGCRATVKMPEVPVTGQTNNRSDQPRYGQGQPLLMLD